MAHRHAALASLALCCAACSTGLDNEEGNLAAEETGSIITSLAPREPPDAELLDRCGDGTPAVAFRRLPFVQQVTPKGLLVVFRPPAPGALEVEVSTLDGLSSARIVSEADPSVVGGGQQIARLTGLDPNTAYCYALPGLTASAGARTAPAPGSGAKVRFAVFGDSGSGTADQRALFEQLGTVPLDFALHTGDLAYGSGTASQLQGHAFDAYASLLRSFPLYPVAGNHDYATNAAAPFYQAFVLPENGYPASRERWYSFDWGDAHFVGLDTERIDEQQIDWLEGDLTANRLPWVVAFSHKPPYSSGEHGGDAAFRRHFVPILERHRVALVLSGHDHDYERTIPLNGVTYVVTGGGGRGTRDVGHREFTAFSQAVIHFVFVEIEGARLTLHAIDGTGREFDQGVIDQTLD